jgi:hypothetical protein
MIKIIANFNLQAKSLAKLFATLHYQKETSQSKSNSKIKQKSITNEANGRPPKF